MKNNHKFQLDKSLTRAGQHFDKSIQPLIDDFTDSNPLLDIKKSGINDFSLRMAKNLCGVVNSVHDICQTVQANHLLDQCPTRLATIWFICNVQKRIKQTRKAITQWFKENLPEQEFQGTEELDKGLQNTTCGSTRADQLANNIVSGLNALYTQCIELRDVFVSVLNQASDEFEQLHLEQYDIRSDIEQEQKEYMRLHRKECHNSLTIEAQRFKSNRCEGLKPSHYSEVYKLDIEPYSGKTLTPGYNEALRELMIANPGIMKRFGKCNIDENLWTHDFFINFGSEVIYRNLLNSDNIEMFQESVLRHVLLQCEMFPNLNPELEAWLDPGQKAKTDVKPENSNALKTDKTTIALAEQLAANLCLCKHWTDNITHTQIRDFTFGIMGINTPQTQTSKKQAESLRAMLCTSKRAKSDSLRTITLMIVGHLIRKGKIDGSVSSRDLCRSIFTEDNWHATISKTRKGDYGKAFSEVLPLIDENIGMHLVGQ